MKELKVMIPKSKKDLEELAKLDKEGKLVSGSTYPTEKQLSEFVDDVDPTVIEVSDTVDSLHNL